MSRKPLSINQQKLILKIYLNLNTKKPNWTDIARLVNENIDVPNELSVNRKDIKKYIGRFEQYGACCPEHVKIRPVDTTKADVIVKHFKKTPRETQRKASNKLGYSKTLVQT